MCFSLNFIYKLSFPIEDNIICTYKSLFSFSSDTNHKSCELIHLETYINFTFFYKEYFSNFFKLIVHYFATFFLNRFKEGKKINHKISIVLILIPGVSMFGTFLVAMFIFLVNNESRTEIP